MRLFLAVFALMSAAAPTAASAAPAPTWSLVIHGGAGVMARDHMSPAKEAEYKAALAHALDIGGAVLAKGGSAVDAVEATVRVLEDDPHFNAGKGAVFTADGTNELDAAIMDGANRKAGAVAGVTRTKNPVSLARAVMEHSPHVMLARDGADQFSREQGLEQVDPGYFRTEERWQQLLDMRAAAAKGAQLFDKNLKYGTVGAVARDQAGHVAAATSTGGLTGKRWGRIGDSPIIGAGTYADDRACAGERDGIGRVFHPRKRRARNLRAGAVLAGEGGPAGSGLRRATRTEGHGRRRRRDRGRAGRHDGLELQHAGHVPGAGVVAATKPVVAVFGDDPHYVFS